MRTWVSGLVLPFMLPFMTACTAISASTPSPAPELSASAAKVEHDIVVACLGSGLFKIADGFALAPVPGGTELKFILDAGVDQVCKDPSRFAAAADTAVWVAHNLRDIVAAAKKAG